MVKFPQQEPRVIAESLGAFYGQRPKPAQYSNGSVAQFLEASALIGG